MSAILQTAYTSPNIGGSSTVPSNVDGSAGSIVGESGALANRDLSRGEEGGGLGPLHSEQATEQVAQGQHSSAPDLDGMTTHAASSVADTSEFPLDFSEDPASQLFAAESDPENEDDDDDDTDDHDSPGILIHHERLGITGLRGDRNVGMSPLFVDTSSATSSPTRSIRPRTPHAPTPPARHLPDHLSAERGDALDLGQNNER